MLDSNEQALFSRSAKTSEVIYGCENCGNLGDVCCAIGVFDGVHMGHRSLIADCIADARARSCKSVIITFDIDPEELFCAHSARKLLSNSHRIAALSRLGADVVLVQTFSQQFAQMQPQDFLRTLIGKMTPKSIYVGHNFRFGCKAAGNVDLMRSELAGTNCEVMGEQLVCQDDEPVTATRIRDLIENGKLEMANQMLGRPHFIQATVVVGRQVGRTLGYPTANLETTSDYVNLCEGAYSGYVLVGGKWHKAAISVGVPKTFGNLKATIEANLIDFDEDIYGANVIACFTHYLRPMVKFENTDQLIEALNFYTRAATEQPDEPNMLL